MEKSSWRHRTSFVKCLPVNEQGGKPSYRLLLRGFAYRCRLGADFQLGGTVVHFRLSDDTLSKTHQDALLWYLLDNLRRCLG